MNKQVKGYIGRRVYNDSYNREREREKSEPIPVR